MLTRAATACDAFVAKFTERTQQALRQLSASSLSLGIDCLTRLVAINVGACHPKTFLQQALERIDSIEGNGKLSAESDVPIVQLVDGWV